MPDLGGRRIMDSLDNQIGTFSGEIIGLRNAEAVIFDQKLLCPAPGKQSEDHQQHAGNQPKSESPQANAFPEPPARYGHSPSPRKRSRIFSAAAATLPAPKVMIR